MAMNIWRSRGAGRKQQTLGLGDVSILLPNADALGSAVERINHFGSQAVFADADVARFEDPWGNQVSLQLNSLS